MAPPKHIPGKAGGGWDDSDDDDDVDDTNDVASDRDQSQSVDSGSCGTGDQRYCHKGTKNFYTSLQHHRYHTLVQ